MLLGLGTPNPIPAPLLFVSLSQPGLALERMVGGLPGLTLEWSEARGGGGEGKVETTRRGEVALER